VKEAPVGTKLHLLYKEFILDNEGLPKVTDDEALAIATYIASIDYFKRGLATNNANLITLSSNLTKKYAVQVD